MSNLDKTIETCDRITQHHWDSRLKRQPNLRRILQVYLVRARRHIANLEVELSAPCLENRDQRLAPSPSSSSRRRRTPVRRYAGLPALTEGQKETVLSGRASAAELPDAVDAVSR